MRPHGRARVNPSHPEAFAHCERCGFLRNLVDLQNQTEWAGTRLISKNLQVCSGCLDDPNEQFRHQIIPPDPRPVPNPTFDNLTELFANDWIVSGGEWNDDGQWFDLRFWED